MYTVVYRWQDCKDAHDDAQTKYRTERGAEEQAKIHNGLCPHYGVPVACAIVVEHDAFDINADGEVTPA
jgi:hypothetical protein